ncbi:hypothetical protein [Streptomyces ureilyticus]|uniref:DUF308 domain-containing protein n=1 Tax=Streptomyces ureilyticus TaxID=1775131 RepID=A0ABX0EAA6_9ACTN|nr:hypothetical protein [Streptomyces ureilyticus]NGO49156.1 hypothetical protein [Streptomyces ureilyticus]
MAEHDADREPEEKDAPPGEEQGPSFDEAAAWAAIVAGYGDEPPDPPGAKPFKSVEDLALLESGTNDAKGPNGPDDADSERPGGTDTKERPKGSEASEGSDGGTADDQTTAGKKADLRKGGDKPAGDKPLGSSVAFPPGVGGPRDYQAPEPSEEDFDADDEGHFVPPEPPPLPAADTTAKFAWLAVLGGPLLLLLAVLLGWHMTWWLTTLGIGGFVGGFGTLVLRMHPGDEDEDDDPGRGAVV